MTAIIVAQTAAILLLGMLVAGLLRSHAEILRRLHDLGAGDAPHSPAPLQLSSQRGQTAPDLSGTTPADEMVAIPMAGTAHDTILAFLSSGCLTCAEFWEGLGRIEELPLPSGTRPVVITRGPASESPTRVADLAPVGVTVIMSEAAWEDYGVPGSPYFVYLSGGTVRGEGTASTWAQLGNLLEAAVGDARPEVAGVGIGGDAYRGARADAELARAGIHPGHPSLYPEENGSP